MKPITLKILKKDIKTLSSDIIEKDKINEKYAEHINNAIDDLANRITELENSQYKITKAIKSLGRFIPRIRLENTPKIKVNF